ncbi:hypothetical protein O181_021421 [Austropuccinia psidii MF-1]|uniref:Uncharacterized protein n=1 Tax=Austropuccinia psidii MF-1 TaxID=1389203 RepID=A0A9Q3GVR8_9BASI|nr:hypothetical protein [Austropuccinia psidii MF-1]
MKHLKLEAELQYYVCCQSCYSLYDIDDSPLECKYHITSDPSVCGAKRFEKINLLSLERTISSFKSSRNIPQRNKLQHKKPISIFASQNFSEWLQWFLSLPQIESLIEEWSKSLDTNSSDVVDYCNSAAWQRLSSKVNSDFNIKNNSLFLLFSLFVDWFNPLGNKISGKQNSLGILSLTCLNLPPSVRYKSQYTFVAGMIPAPNQPNMITMSNVLKPLVKDLLELTHPKNFQTHQFPLGRAVVVHLGALIGDVVATHKAAVFS